MRSLTIPLIITLYSISLYCSEYSDFQQKNYQDAQDQERLNRVLPCAAALCTATTLASIIGCTPNTPACILTCLCLTCTQLALAEAYDKTITQQPQATDNLEPQKQQIIN